MSDNQGATGRNQGGSSNQGGQVDHVDSILNEFMQNPERRNNYGFETWLGDPHSHGDHYGAQGNFHDWQEQHGDPSFDTRGDYYADQSAYGGGGYGDYEVQHGGYYGETTAAASAARYHHQHDGMNMRSTPQQPPARHHIQQVHPRNSSLHTTNIGGLRPQQQHPGVGSGGLGGGGMYPRGGGSYSPSLPPTNLLVHQQYRPAARGGGGGYDDRYLQHTTPPPLPLQSHGQQQQYSNMSHYDLSTHVRNQGAMNWSTGNAQVASSGNSRQGMMSGGGGGQRNGGGGGGTRYSPQQPNQMSHYTLSGGQGGQHSPNFLVGSNSSASSAPLGGGGGNGTGTGRSLLVQSTPVAPRSMNPSNPSSSSSSSSLLNRSQDMAGRDIELEQLIYRNAKAILAETANRCLKSVELANALRDRIGKEALQRTKVLYGGLLVLLELYRETFAVHRIPKNDMVELLAYVAPPYASHVIQHPQQLLASQIPGYNISAPNLNSGNSFPNGSSSMHSLFPSSGSGGGDSSRSHSNSPIGGRSGVVGNSSDTPSPTLFQTLAKQQLPTKCLFISNVPDDISGNQIWAEFGGEDIVEKVSVDYQGDQRTGVVWFTSVNAAKAALNIPSLVKWKDVLSFIDPLDVAMPTMITESTATSTTTAEDHTSPSVHMMTNVPTTMAGLLSRPSSNGTISSVGSSFEDSFGPPPGLTEPSHLMASSSYLPSAAAAASSSASNRAGHQNNTFFDVSVTMEHHGRDYDHLDHSSSAMLLRHQQDHHLHHHLGGDDNLIVDLSSLGISTSHLDHHRETPPSSTGSSPLTLSATNSPKSSSASFRKAAPPPILTGDLTSLTPSTYENNNPTPHSVQSLSPGPSPTSTPGSTPHLSFTFFDNSAPGGITTLPKETLPKPIHDVMNTLCDVYYVPQKTWEKSSMGDYLFCQAIVDILSGQFNGVFVQMTKLKQQLKRKLGGSIRIGPLKALVIAYPEYFEVDRTVNLVRSLKAELPYMDISFITSA